MPDLIVIQGGDVDVRLSEVIDIFQSYFACLRNANCNCSDHYTRLVKACHMTLFRGDPGESMHVLRLPAHARPLARTPSDRRRYEIILLALSVAKVESSFEDVVEFARRVGAHLRVRNDDKLVLRLESLFALYKADFARAQTQIRSCA